MFGSNPLDHPQLGEGVPVCEGESRLRMMGLTGQTFLDDIAYKGVVVNYTTLFWDLLHTHLPPTLHISVKWC